MHLNIFLDVYVHEGLCFRKLFTLFHLAGSMLCVYLCVKKLKISQMIHSCVLHQFMVLF